MKNVYRKLLQYSVYAGRYDEPFSRYHYRTLIHEAPFDVTPTDFDVLKNEIVEMLNGDKMAVHPANLIAERGKDFDRLEINLYTTLYYDPQDFLNRERIDERLYLQRDRESGKWRMLEEMGWVKNY